MYSLDPSPSYYPYPPSQPPPFSQPYGPPLSSQQYLHQHPSQSYPPSISPLYQGPPFSSQSGALPQQPLSQQPQLYGPPQVPQQFIQSLPQQYGPSQQAQQYGPPLQTQQLPQQHYVQSQSANQQTNQGFVQQNYQQVQAQSPQRVVQVQQGRNQIQEVVQVQQQQAQQLPQQFQQAQVSQQFSQAQQGSQQFQQVQQVSQQYQQVQQIPQQYQQVQQPVNFQPVSPPSIPPQQIKTSIRPQPLEKPIVILNCDMKNKFSSQDAYLPQIVDHTDEHLLESLNLKVERLAKMEKVLNSQINQKISGNNAKEVLIGQIKEQKSKLEDIVRLQVIRIDELKSNCQKARLDLDITTSIVSETDKDLDNLKELLSQKEEVVSQWKSRGAEIDRLSSDQSLLSSQLSQLQAQNQVLRNNIKLDPSYNYLII